MDDEQKKWKESVLSLEKILYENIEMCFINFKNENPNLESLCDKKTMNNWYDFIKWVYSQEDVEYIEFEEQLGIEESNLISSAHEICIHFYYKYNAHMIEEAKYMLCKEDDDHFDPAFYAIEEAKTNIINTCNVSTFEELSKIKIDE